MRKKTLYIYGLLIVPLSICVIIILNFEIINIDSYLFYFVFACMLGATILMIHDEDYLEITENKKNKEMVDTLVKQVAYWASKFPDFREKLLEEIEDDDVTEVKL